MQSSKSEQPLRQSHDEALKFESPPSDADSDFVPPPSSADSDSNDKSAASDNRKRWIPSPLSRLDGKNFHANVDDQRVEYLKDTNHKGAPSEMTMTELHAVAKIFPWPENVMIRLPCSDGKSLAKYPGCTVVYEEALKAGFRLPLHPFVCDFLADTGLCPAQFTPNAWRCILAFLLKFKELNLVPSYEAFKFMSDLRLSLNGVYTLYFQGINLITNPHNPQSWDKKWFLVCQTEEFHFDFPMYPGVYVRGKGYSGKEQKKIESRVQGFVQVFKSLPKQKIDHKKVITARRLEEAGLSLRHEMPRPADAYEQCVAKRRREAELIKSDGLTKKAKSSPPQSVKVENNEVTQEEAEDEDPEEEPESSPVREIEVSSSEGGSSISTLCRPEVSTALKHLPEILLAAQHSEDLQRQLSECRKENAELKREKASDEAQIRKLWIRERKLIGESERKERELKSRIERLELEKRNADEELMEKDSKLVLTSQKAKELLEIASPLLKHSK